MSDQLQSESIDAWVAGQLAFREFGEFIIVAPRQVLANLAQLLLDQVEIVDQPLACRRSRALWADGSGELTIGGKELPCILFHPSEQRPPSPRSDGDSVLFGKPFRILLKALDAE